MTDMNTDDKNQLEKLIEKTVSQSVSKLGISLDSINRALVGAPLEGNPGLLVRMQKVERKVAIMVWMLPIWVTGGTALGQWLVSIWGL